MNRWWLLLSAGLCWFSSTTLAQISLDGSLGPGGPLTGPDFDIAAELGQQHGANLFHSFQYFNVQQGESATFHGPDVVSRIISRVTGGQRSQIDGALRSMIPNADLYLINPAGLLFGPNATLDVSGGFHASTADRLQFNDGSQFEAHLDRTSTLTAAAVESFGFLGAQTQGITLQQGAQLIVPPEHTLSLLGGDIDLQPGSVVRAAAGRINAAATQGAGTVTPTTNSLQMTTQGGRLQLDNARMEGDDLVPDSSRTYGTAVFYIQAGEFVMVNDAFIGSGNLIPDKLGQAIEIEANTVSLSGNSRLINISEQAGGRAGDIRVNAQETIHLTEGQAVNQIFAGTRFSTSSFGTGDGGNIELTAQHVHISKGARLESDSVIGQSIGGDIQVNADTITVEDTGSDGTPSSIGTSNFSTQGGAAGTIELQAKQVAIINGASVLSFARVVGDGGTVRIVADEKLTVSGQNSGILTTSELLGNSGNIIIRAGELLVAKGGQISAATGGLGQGGNIDIQVTGPVTLSGEADTFTNSNINATGQYSSTFMAFFQPGAELAGHSGSIHLQAESLVLSGGAQINNTIETNGQAGDIVLAITGPVLITGTSSEGNLMSAISSDSGTDNTAGQGVAGNIELRAEQIDLRDQGVISTQANTADGGTITLHTTGYIYAQNGQITTSVGDSVGSGGNVMIDSAFLVLDNSAVIARAVGGPGGNINITTNGIFRFPLVAQSPIDASSQRNVDGVVHINSPDVNLSGSLIVLASDFLDANDSLQPPCSAQLAENLSSFVVIKRAGVSSVGNNDLQPSGGLALTDSHNSDSSPFEDAMTPQAATPAPAQMVLALAPAAMQDCQPLVKD